MQSLSSLYIKRNAGLVFGLYEHFVSVREEKYEGQMYLAHRCFHSLIVC